ncbi:ABC transporter permease [Coraliomargarita akajimensis]|uniref:Oligopeptide transport system permease protein OppC n=1 Tax=Coraliomargarita akajimensis (strain DSM 45221 / IAM 15411 / JCM 23193 / KCTC 12865 / 04OKA010-24) TaxID=583355 RepID=D5EJT0_CORAD|nr:ABC transporter permease [Coraliomargarita akajimensis]ADE54679.1 binding-protein-dependent transport systems inner membrane component [Coraliomargarita akajimensis DSM 45221]
MIKQQREAKAVSVAATSLGQDAWERLKRNNMARIGGTLFAIITALCIVGPWLLPHSYDAQNLAYGAQGPSWQHLLGTDDLGRDLLVRILVGGRISIGVGFAASLVALIIGVSYGALAGYIGGRTESVMMRFVDAVYALPFTMIVIILTVTFDEKSIFLIFMAIGLVEWLTMARIVRGQTKALRQLNYIDAARTMGASHLSILTRHILPNLLGPVIVFTTLTIPAVILLESILSFLGLGVQPPMSSWGILINEGADKIDIYPWLLIFPALFFSLTIFALNFIGDGLRDALDPKESQH